MLKTAVYGVLRVTFDLLCRGWHPGRSRCSA